MSSVAQFSPKVMLFSGVIMGQKMGNVPEMVEEQ